MTRPFAELWRRQRQARFARWSVPPSALGMMWSQVSGFSGEPVCPQSRQAPSSAMTRRAMACHTAPSPRCTAAGVALAVECGLAAAAAGAGDRFRSPAGALEPEGHRVLTRAMSSRGIAACRAWRRAAMRGP
jgi:hypothetical protein